ncbi:MAG: hypothetical protein BGO78_02965 [Chloroflexi bacterium 44-23]|nr:MAG: hypothetical protein BGO78_02965 [Chloroflexi bacterium 44-23]
MATKEQKTTLIWLSHRNPYIRRVQDSNVMTIKISNIHSWPTLHDPASPKRVIAHKCKKVAPVMIFNDNNQDFLPMKIHM